MHHGCGQGRRHARRWSEEAMFEGRRHGRGGAGRGRRVFDSGDLRLVLLELIAQKPRHGYELIKAVEEALAGTYSPSPGVVYPTLAMLEDLGHVTVQATEDGRKLHTVTAGGETFLVQNGPALQTIRERMAAVRSAFGAGPSPRIVRATENLRLALRLRLERGPLGEADVDAIAAAIDAAASAIERT